MNWKFEIGTAETEKALNLTPAEQKEIQQRLTALDLYKGPATGAFNPPTRSAITEWQKSRGVALSSFLGPMQLAELREESEDAYQTLLAPQSAPKSAPAEAVKYPAKPVTRAAKASVRRHVAKRSSSASAPTAVGSLLGYFGRLTR
jgi:peptidoglycan hydrolase-like protein with peptidoglycan-binding domain